MSHGFHLTIDLARLPGEQNELGQKWQDGSPDEYNDCNGGRGRSEVRNDHCDGAQRKHGRDEKLGASLGSPVAAHVQAQRVRIVVRGDGEGYGRGLCLSDHEASKRRCTRFCQGAGAEWNTRRSRIISQRIL